MGECNDKSIEDKIDCVGTFTNDEGATLKRWWGNDDIGNFDNIGAATLTLFEMSTLEMWPDLMFRAMDSNPEEKGRARAGPAPVDGRVPHRLDRALRLLHAQPLRRR